MKDEEGPQVGMKKVPKHIKSIALWVTPKGDYRCGVSTGGIEDTEFRWLSEDGATLVTTLVFNSVQEGFCRPYWGAPCGWVWTRLDSAR